tara:strand:- start:37 stop:300 length:264 start_codon:yes stop_codon:yes gene_type:complete
MNKLEEYESKINWDVWLDVTSFRNCIATSKKHKMGAMIEAILKPDEPSYYEKMVYLKNNYKRLTKGCKVISANWPSFDVKELPVVWN